MKGQFLKISELCTVISGLCRLMEAIQCYREAVAAERQISEENLELQRQAQRAELAAVEERGRISTTGSPNRCTCST